MEVTGPGVTTWRLVRIRPRSASTTKPVACAVEFHSVSKARARSTSIETTLLAMRSSVTAQSGFSSATAGCAIDCGCGRLSPELGGRGPGSALLGGCTTGAVTGAPGATAGAAAVEGGALGAGVALWEGTV